MVKVRGSDWPGRTLLGQLPEDILEALLRLGRKREFARDDVLVVAHQTSTEVYVLLSGSVRVINGAGTRAPALLAVRTCGDLVGEFAALDGEPRVATVIAASPVVAVVIDGSKFRRFVAANPAFHEALQHSVLTKIRVATRLRAGLGQLTVLTKVSRVIEQLADLYGRPVDDGVLVDIPLPQQDLASLAGTSPKGVGRAFTVLRKNGGIDTKYRTVIVRDEKVVRRYADGAAA